MDAATSPAIGIGAGAARYLPAVHARWLDTEPQRRWRAEEATLLFADVSGFTALGERLARSGRVGTEELSDVIKAVFARMLEPVLAVRGDLLKFGGDAVLVLFRGEGHAERGAAAALAMQQAIRSLRGLKTSAGAVSLRLSAGLATGRLHLFLVGSRYKELIVAGPLASEVCTLEADANPGEVLAGVRTTAALDLHRPVPAGRAGLPIRTAPPVAAGAPPAPAIRRPELGLPPHLREHEPGDGEHRTITAAFVQFRGPDELLAAGGPEALADALDELTGAVQEACEAYGVTLVAVDVDNDAGKFYLVTGAPAAARDDVGRMLRAVRSIVSGSHRLPVRGGVNRGRAFVVDVGTPDRLCWSVMGDAVNLAARVMAKAPMGAVLATAEALDHAREPFDRTPVDPFMAKGKRLPVHAELVGEPKGARHVIAADTPLIGRERQLATLREALTLARAGGWPVVQLSGEPGIGKTRLLNAAVADARDFQVVTIAGGPYSAATPYEAVRLPFRELIGAGRGTPEIEVEQALRAHVAERRPDLAPWLPLIGLPFGLELPPTPETSRLSSEFSRARLHAAATALLDALLPGGPLLLVVEDAHWLDDASSDLLAYVVRRLERLQRATIVTRGPATGGLDLAGEDGVTVIELAPLGEEESERLLHDPALPLTPRARAQLLERAAGNPLFLGELLTAARTAGGDVTEIPDTLEALLMARIDTLSEADRGLLRQAAVLGVRIEVEVLAAVVGLDAERAAAALTRLEEFIVPEQPGVVRFRHALARDAAYEALPYRVRRALHARVADVIARRPTAREDAAEILALHFHAANRWRESWQWSRFAGDQATRASAPVEAVGFFLAALEAGRRVPGVPALELGTVAEALGDAAALTARYDAAMAAYRDARRWLREDPLRVAEVLRKEGRLRERAQDYTQAKRWFTRAAKTVEGCAGSDAQALRARIASARGAAELRQGRIRSALPLLHAAVADAEATGDRATLAHAYYLLDWAYTDSGSPEARRYRDLALPIYEELGDQLGQGNVLCNLGIAAYYEGHWDQAVELYDRSRIACERAGDVVQMAAAVNNVAEIRSDQGRLDEAEGLFHSAREIWEAAGFPAGANWALANLGRVAMRRGDLDRAATVLARARTALADLGAEALVLEVDAREAERRLWGGDARGALMLVVALQASQERELATPAVAAMLHRISGAARVTSGDTGGIRELAEAVDFARGAGASYELALALDALATLGDEDAGAHAAEAARIFAGLGVIRPPAVPVGAAAAGSA